MASDTLRMRQANVHPTLRDAEAQAHFARDGVVVVPLLAPDEATALRAELLEQLPDDPGAFLDLFRNNPPALRKQLDRLVRDRLEDRAAEVFDDHDFWSATVLVKPPGEAGEIGLHTDWNMVDEERYRSGLIWVALSDTDEANGGLYVVPGTNRLDVPWRGHSVHYDFDDPEVRAAIDAHTVPMPVPCGHAAIWDNRLLHGSGPNTGTDWRIAAALGFKPREAALYHFRPDASGTRRRYRIEREFFLDYQPFDPDEQPAGPHVLAEDDVEEAEFALTVAALEELGPPGPIYGCKPREESPPMSTAGSVEPTPTTEPARPRWWERLRGRRTPMPRTLALRWHDLEVGEVGDHPDALADIAARRLDGLTVRGVFSADECAEAIARLEAKPGGRYDAMFGEMLGMSLANLAFHTGDPSQRDPYFDDADEVRSRYLDAFGMDPFDRVAEVLAPAAGPRRLMAAQEGDRTYLAGNVRWMAPGGRALPAHVGNEFQQQSDGSTDHLRAVTRINDHYSWFVVLQPPEEGGALSVFDLLYESDVATGDWGLDGRDDEAFDRRPARRIAPEAGQLVIFGGGWRWHRVERIGGTRPRITFGGFAGPSVDGTEIHSWF